MISGCGRKTPPPPRPAPPVAVIPKTAPQSAEDYVRLESSRSLLAVRASELAMTRSTNGRALQVASRLKADHTGIASQLSMAGRRLNLLPSATMLMPDQALFDGLSRASDFDSAFLRTMRSLVENCSRAHASYADNGSSPTLRPVARFAASTCSDELGAL
jgi:putative membrane protein